MDDFSAGGGGVLKEVVGGASKRQLTRPTNHPNQSAWRVGSLGVAIVLVVVFNNSS